MELQIIESISKHAVTLVLVIGILMLTDKGIMPTGIIAMLLLTSFTNSLSAVKPQINRKGKRRRAKEIRVDIPQAVK